MTIDPTTCAGMRRWRGAAGVFYDLVDCGFRASA
jgi:hypothetical protein